MLNWRRWEQANPEGHDMLKAAKFSLAGCALSAVLLGVVVVAAVNAPTSKPAAHEAGNGWNTIVFKNPH